MTKNDIVELEHILWKELGTKEDYDKYVEKGKMLCGGHVAAFIRAQVGIDRKVALDKFSQFLSGNVLNAVQEEYLKTIITYVCQNGDISIDVILNDDVFDPDKLRNAFSDISSIGKYVNCLHSCIVA